MKEHIAFFTCDNRLELILDNNDNKYYISYKNNSTIMFDILNDWKFVKNENVDVVKYLTTSTKTKIIQELRARTPYNNKIQDFIKWYDESQSGPTSDIQNTNANKDILEGIQKAVEDIKNIASHNKFEETIIDGIIEKAKKESIEEIKSKIVDYTKEFVNTTYGKLPSTIEIINNGERTHVEGLFHKNFEQIIKIVSQKIPLMLVGPAGSGKNHTLEQVAEALNLPFYFSNSITQEYKLTGFIDAGGTYHETEFYKAFTNGGLFFFDEIDASCAEALIIINAALANGYFDFPNGRINAHRDFRVVAAANTFGNGADMIYVGRNQLDGATLDRFAVMEFDYDENIEKTICNDNELYNFIIDIRNAIKKRRLRFVVSMRATINASKMLAAGIDKETIVKTVITKSMTKDDINTIIQEINKNNEWSKYLK